ncbi:hypothetical protein BY996DRAFT_4607754 [Phakopsora pachyrhizi]|nr:hypothetical protein BY996DRAFT_4607754 [Phakopsora pachyrhizi]
MTTLATGLSISRTQDTKMTPALRLAVQRATSVFQKDFCYDLLQAMVDEPEIADPVGIRVFLNFCLKKPDTLVDSFLDSIDQNVILGISNTNLEAFNDSAETILNEVENFIEFINGLVELIDSGIFFKLNYHEIDAWKVCYRALEQVQRRLFDLAVQDRQRLTDRIDEKLNSLSKDEIELTFASQSTSSGFFSAFVAIDKFLKHSFESRVLLEPAKLVEDLEELNERKNELATFRKMFPPVQSSTTIHKKSGRFGREEAAIDQFLDSEKFKELSKRKSLMLGGQLTRQPSTRAKKKPTNELVDTASLDKRSVSDISVQKDSESNGIDPHSRDPPSPVGKIAFADGSDSEDEVVQKRRRSFQPAKSTSRREAHGTTSSASKKSTNRHSLPASNTSSSSRKRRGRSQTSNDKDEHQSSTKRSRTNSTAKKSSRNSSSKKINSNRGIDDDDENDNEGGRDQNGKGEDEEEEDGEDFVIDRIIGESVDVDGKTIYRVLWAGYPESDATWQFANTLDDCAALDVWQEEKRLREKEERLAKEHQEKVKEKGDDNTNDIDASGKEKQGSINDEKGSGEREAQKDKEDESGKSKEDGTGALNGRDKPSPVALAVS